MGPVADDPERLLTLLRNDAATAEQRAAELLPMVYDELRTAAQRALREERAGHTLQATALVHEAWLRLMGPREVPWRNRGHFLAAAAEAMRRILVDHARAKTAQRRGGKTAKRAAIELSSLPDPASEEQSAGFLLLDAAMEALAAVEPRAAEVVRLRYFVGLTIDEAALALDASPATVERDWAFARSWLKDAIARMDDESAGS